MRWMCGKSLRSDTSLLADREPAGGNPIARAGPLLLRHEVHARTVHAGSARTQDGNQLTRRSKRHQFGGVVCDFACVSERHESAVAHFGELLSVERNGRQAGDRAMGRLQPLRGGLGPKLARTTTRQRR